MTRALRRFFARLLAKLRGVDVPIPTFVAGNILTAAQLNTITAALPIVDAWTSYTPTLTQSATVTKTVTYARYMKVGRTVFVSMFLTVTGAGTAANAVVVGLPPFAPVSSANQSMGIGVLQDISATNAFTFNCRTLSTTTFRLQMNPAGGAEQYLGSAIFTAALASPDVIECSFFYESTT